MAIRFGKEQLKECDVCGFVFNANQLRKQNGLWKCPSDYDLEKPPEAKRLGGTGEVNRGEIRTNWDTTDIPSVSLKTVHYITNSGGINVDRTEPWMVIQASSTAVDDPVIISKNPQISAGLDQYPPEVLSLHHITDSPKLKIESARGISLMGAQAFTMGSGDVLTLIWDTGALQWKESSRGKYGG
jgi:hypothetical protein